MTRIICVNTLLPRFKCVWGIKMWMLLAKSDVELGDAALISIIGFALVVGVLLILVCLFYLSGFLFKKLDAHLEGKQTAAAAPAAITPSDDEEEVVAAIIAAVSVILSEETQSVEPPPFVVKSIKPLD